MNQLNYQYLAKSVPFEENGKILLSIGFHITFYFGDGNMQYKRRAIVELFNEYNRLCGDCLKWQVHPATFNWQGIKEEHSAKNWILKNPKNINVWQATMHGGKAFDESSPYRIEAVGYPKPDRKLSYFTVGFPFDWFAEANREDPVKLVTRWSDILIPWYGTAGMTVMPSMHPSMERITSSHVYALMRRFPGLEYNNPNSHRMYLKKSIKSVNWLTIIQNEFIGHLGGLSALKKAFGGDGAIQLHSYEGGVVIQAGSYPEIGDVNAGLIPAHYKAVNDILKPIRVGSEHKPFLGFSDDETQEWLARFD